MMDDFRSALKMQTLQSIDQFAQQVVASAGRTALYNYDQAGETWSKTDVEGTLILYARNAHPRHMLTIINKNNKSNFIEPITKNCDAQLKTPYVLLRNDTLKILGIWFADQSDVPRIYNSISNFIKLETQGNNKNASELSSSVSSELIKEASMQNRPDAGDIMSMLSKAHGEFTTKRSDITEDIFSLTAISSTQLSPNNDHAGDMIKLCPTIMSPRPTNEDTFPNTIQPPQNNTVADFFAKVGGVGLTPAISAASKLPLSGAPFPDETSIISSKHNPVLQQLFQEAAAAGGQASVVQSGNVNNCVNMAASSTSAMSAPSVAAEKPGSIPPAPMSLQELEGKLRENVQVSLPVTVHSSREEHGPQHAPFADLFSEAPKLISNKTNIMVPHLFNLSKSLIDDSPMPQAPQHFAEVGVKVTPGNNSSESVGVPFRIIPQAPPGLSVTNMPPQMNTFSPPSTAATGRKESPFACNKLNGSLTRGPVSRPVLTQQQFVMALSHALTKEDFVNQLYQAYEEVVLKTSSS